MPVCFFCDRGADKFYLVSGWKKDPQDKALVMCIRCFDYLREIKGYNGPPPGEE